MHRTGRRTASRQLLIGGVLVPVAALVGLSAAPPGTRAQQSSSAARVYAGMVEGSDALIAVVLDGRQVLAYLCDGTPEGVSLWGWFVGERSAAQLTLVSTNGHALLLDLSGEAPSGRVVTRTGAMLAFATEGTPGTALWRAQGVVDGQPVLAAWVVRAGGEQRGAKVQAGAAGTVGFIDPTTDLRRPQVVNVGSGALAALAVGFIDPTSDI